MSSAESNVQIVTDFLVRSDAVREGLHATEDEVRQTAQRIESTPINVPINIGGGTGDVRANMAAMESDVRESIGRVQREIATQVEQINNSAPKIKIEIDRDALRAQIEEIRGEIAYLTSERAAFDISGASKRTRQGLEMLDAAVGGKQVLLERLEGQYAALPGGAGQTTLSPTEAMPELLLPGAPSGGGASPAAIGGALMSGGGGSLALRGVPTWQGRWGGFGPWETGNAPGSGGGIATEDNFEGSADMGGPTWGNNSWMSGQGWGGGDGNGGGGGGGGMLMLPGPGGGPMAMGVGTGSGGMPIPMGGGRGGLFNIRTAWRVAFALHAVDRVAERGRREYEEYLDASRGGTPEELLQRESSYVDSSTGLNYWVNKGYGALFDGALGTSFDRDTAQGYLDEGRNTLQRDQRRDAQTARHLQTSTQLRRADEDLTYQASTSAEPNEFRRRTLEINETFRKTMDEVQRWYESLPRPSDADTANYNSATANALTTKINTTGENARASDMNMVGLDYEATAARQELNGDYAGARRTRQAAAMVVRAEQERTGGNLDYFNRNVKPTLDEQFERDESLTRFSGVLGATSAALDWRAQGTIAGLQAGGGGTAAQSYARSYGLQSRLRALYDRRANTTNIDDINDLDLQINAANASVVDQERANADMEDDQRALMIAGEIGAAGSYYMQGRRNDYSARLANYDLAASARMLGANLSPEQRMWLGDVNKAGHDSIERENDRARTGIHAITAGAAYRAQGLSSMADLVGVEADIRQVQLEAGGDPNARADAKQYGLARLDEFIHRNRPHAQFGLSGAGYLNMLQSAVFEDHETGGTQATAEATRIRQSLAMGGGVLNSRALETGRTGDRLPEAADKLMHAAEHLQNIRVIGVTTD